MKSMQWRMVGSHCPVTPLRVFLQTLIVNTPSDHCTAQPAPPRPLTTGHKYALSATYTTYWETDKTFSYLQNNFLVSGKWTSFIYDDILELNAVVEPPSFHSFLLRSRLFIGCLSIGVTAHWLTKCKHKPRDTEVDAPIKYVMCQNFDKNTDTSQTTTCHYWSLPKSYMLKTTVDSFT